VLCCTHAVTRFTDGGGPGPGQTPPCIVDVSGAAHAGGGGASSVAAARLLGRANHLLKALLQLLLIPGVVARVLLAARARPVRRLPFSLS